MCYNVNIMRVVRVLFSCLLLAVFAVVPVSAMSETQEKAVKEHCESIKEVLKNAQKDDSRARVYLGAYYETVLTDFMMPLNVRLVENNLSSAGLVENQNKMADAKELFTSDFVNYQKALEELVAMDCKTEPKAFYEKLEKVRQKRKTVEQDTLRVRSVVSEHLKLVNQLEGKV